MLRKAQSPDKNVPMGLAGDRHHVELCRQDSGSQLRPWNAWLWCCVNCQRSAIVNSIFVMRRISLKFEVFNPFAAGTPPLPTQQIEGISTLILNYDGSHHSQKKMIWRESFCEGNISIFSFSFFASGLVLPTPPPPHPTPALNPMQMEISAQSVKAFCACLNSFFRFLYTSACFEK